MSLLPQDVQSLLHPAISGCLSHVVKLPGHLDKPLVSCPIGRLKFLGLGVASKDVL